jgi:NAD(P)-dependent dehydrogenase (short-subunit alcohol dehydrogenase family)
LARTALITGAAGGLGQAVAGKLDAAGWQLVLTSRDSGRLAACYGARHLQVEADCSIVAGARHILEAARAHGSAPTALAHCVGNIRLGALHRMSETDFSDCLRANLLSAFHTLAAFVGALRDTKSAGSAVLVSSAAARIGTPNHEAVAAAKAGVEGLVRGAAATYAAAGIRAVAITKCDAAAPERVSEVRAEIGAALSGTALADIPHFPLSGLTGKGVAALRAHLEQAAASVTARDDDAPFRLAIDRCFSLAATGTVVTGTAFSGTVKSGDTLYVSPPGIAVRVRSLHVQDRPAICGRAGERCALNIAGPDVDRSRV